MGGALHMSDPKRGAAEVRYVAPLGFQLSPKANLNPRSLRQVFSADNSRQSLGAASDTHHWSEEYETQTY